MTRKRGSELATKILLKDGANIFDRSLNNPNKSQGWGQRITVNFKRKDKNLQGTRAAKPWSKMVVE